MTDPRAPKRIKTTTTCEESSKCITYCLPKEILEDIASKVASQSLADLYHLKLTSKEMMNITDDDYVYKHAYLDRVPFFRIKEIPQEESFLRRCRSSGNLESLYRQGTKEYFLDNELYVKGLGLVRLAAQKGHKRSMYAFAMIVLMHSDARKGSLGPKELEEALGYLRLLRNQKCVLKCRNEVVEFVRFLKWFMRFGLEMAPREHLCRNVPCTNTWRLRTGSWCLLTDEDDENDPNMCESCRWDLEVKEFFAMI
ncbi:hypothetical protein QN277_001821 [Acacia crassicarpa]|uniref:At2g35280-like TPR domain-containing protein n=1 Tax=Acacia crassicarpa TaxID=499986 RepID=A0AAE1TH83_9FABA|nr:hypothetical protein QN277_001821 [Acacia crassicarpa]